jgi:hypothetical protein
MDLSSPGSLMASLAVGSVGLGLFMYGRRRQAMSHLSVGVTMMVYPYFVTGTVLMLGIGGALLAGLWIKGRAG